MVLDISEEAELPAIAPKIIQFAGDYRIWLLEGEMGAGKTTLTKAICQVLEVIDPVSSPTFSLINEYQTASEDTVYHFDFYRIESLKEAQDLGLDEYFYSGDLCIIEWPEMIDELIPEKYLKINIKFIDSNRTIDLTKHGPEDQGD